MAGGEQPGDVVVRARARSPRTLPLSQQAKRCSTQQGRKATQAALHTPRQQGRRSHNLSPSGRPFPPQLTAAQANPDPQSPPPPPPLPAGHPGNGRQHTHSHIPHIHARTRLHVHAHMHAQVIQRAAFTTNSTRQSYKVTATGDAPLIVTLAYLDWPGADFCVTQATGGNGGQLCMGWRSPAWIGRARAGMGRVQGKDAQEGCRIKAAVARSMLGRRCAGPSLAVLDPCRPEHAIAVCAARYCTVGGSSHQVSIGEWSGPPFPLPFFPTTPPAPAAPLQLTRCHISRCWSTTWT